MTLDLLDLYGKASDWTLANVSAAGDGLDDPTPCSEWTVRDLLNHIIETQTYFVRAARGEDASPPSPEPPRMFEEDPLPAFEQARRDVLATFGQDGAIERTGPSLGIAFSDVLIHGWDLAVAAGADPSMPEGLASAAYDTIHGRFTDEQRKGIFKPEIVAEPDASPQDKLLAYTGRGNLPDLAS